MLFVVRVMQYFLIDLSGKILFECCLYHIIIEN